MGEPEEDVELDEPVELDVEELELEVEEIDPEDAPPELLVDVLPVDDEELLSGTAELEPPPLLQPARATVRAISKIRG